MTEVQSAARAAVVYESMFGNTRIIAEAIAEGLRQQGLQVTCTSVDKARSRTEAHQSDVLILGAPTHAFSLSREHTRADAVGRGAPVQRSRIGLREWLAAVRPRPDSPLPVVAVFDTRASRVRRLPAAADAAARLVRRHGLRIVGGPTGFLVQGSPGPLCPGERQRATEWGHTIGHAFMAGSTTPESKHPTVPHQQVMEPPAAEDR